jgi:hypothetical protein
MLSQDLLARPAHGRQIGRVAADNGPPHVQEKIGVRGGIEDFFKLERADVDVAKQLF